MKVVDKHLAREFFKVFWIAVTIFLSLFVMVDVFEKLRLILKYHPAAGDMLLYFAARLPWILSQVIPIATLLATVMSLTLLARHGEITALRCGGVPLRRLVLPYLVCGTVLAVLAGFVQEFASPRGFAFAREVEQIRIKGRSPLSLLKTEDLWLRSASGVIHVGRVDPEAAELNQVSVAVLEENRVVRRVDAQKAHWNGQLWQLSDAEIRSFDPDGISHTERQPTYLLDLGSRPEDFRIAELQPDDESWADLKRRVERYRAQGLETQELEVGLWSKTSLPFVCLVMPLLAFPFGIRAGRRGSTSLGIVLAVILGFSFLLVSGMFLSLGKADALPPALAAWSGNILFAALGAVLLWRAEGSG